MSALMRDGRVRRAYLGVVVVPAPGGHEVAVAQDLQRLMFAEAIGRPLSVTVMRNGALVDVIAEPTELVAA